MKQAPNAILGEDNLFLIQWHQRKNALGRIGTSDVLSKQMHSWYEGASESYVRFISWQSGNARCSVLSASRQPHGVGRGSHELLVRKEKRFVTG